jgi:hypothetical protein
VTDRWQQTWKNTASRLRGRLQPRHCRRLLFIAQDPRPSASRVRRRTRSAFPDYVASLVGAPVTRAMPTPSCTTATRRFRHAAAIDSAKTRINFETYVYKDGEIGDRFVDALARAAERGVVVRVVLDPVGSLMKPKNATG